jgi:hypothetical protein
MLRDLAVAALVLGAVAMVAVGVSGLASAGLGSAFGKSFVAGDPPGTHYPAARCADFLEYHPHAHGCAAAATAHHFDEIVSYRSAAGVLGVIALAALWFWRRRHDVSWALLPEGFVATIGCVAFGLAALVCAGNAADRLTTGGRDAGAGQFLSAAIVAVLAFVPFARSLLDTFAHRLPPASRQPPNATLDTRSVSSAV